jgi:hypothetical protein
MVKKRGEGGPKYFSVQIQVTENNPFRIYKKYKFHSCEKYIFVN